MAEAVAALGLAANIVTFVDFSFSILKQVKQTYLAGRMGQPTLPETAQLTRNLESICQDLKSPYLASDDSEHGLQALLAECTATASEVRTVIDSLRVDREDGRKKALQKALKSTWDENKVSTLQSRLEKLQDQITVRILAVVRIESRKSLVQQEDLIQRLNSLLSLGSSQSRLSKSEAGLGTRLISMLTSKAEASTGEETHYIWERRACQKLLSDSSQYNTEAALEIDATWSSKREQKLLDFLTYQVMDDRSGRITEAHSKTYAWIFEEPGSIQRKWSSFRAWLESKDKLYWVTGKPGSGKSTLMKYISTSQAPGESSPQYHKYLDKWTGTKRLITANFYFWNSGSSLQASRIGFLKSVLHQIISQAPEVIPVALPESWEALCLFDATSNSPLKMTQLEGALEAVLHEVSEHNRVMLFIDGLDEFDGDHKELALYLKGLVVENEIKLCAASRPWNVFEDVFGSGPNLMLQDLTYEDIRNYTSSTLRGDDIFHLLQQREPEYAEELTDNIVSKASGVFLWVSLVTKSLVAGIEHGDRIVDLQRRLDLLPEDLEHLYQKMLDSLDPFYLEHAAQLIQLVEGREEPLGLLEMSFADDDALRKALKRNIGPISESERTIQCDAMRRRLNSCTKGFLEAPRNPQDLEYQSVQYLHRTVRDFLRIEQVQQRFQQALTSPFDIHVHYGAARLSELKSVRAKSMLHPNLNMRSSEQFWFLAISIMWHAGRISRDHQDHAIQLMVGLDDTGSALAKELSRSGAATAVLRQAHLEIPLGCGQWTHLYPDPNYRLSKHFISLAARMGVSAYVKAKANPGCFVMSTRPNTTYIYKTPNSPRLFSYQPVSLLTEAFTRSDNELVRWTGLSESVPDPRLVQCLLDRGAKLDLSSMPTHQRREDQPWYRLFDTIHAVAFAYEDTPTTDQRLGWAEVLDVVINSGQLSAKIKKEALALRSKAFGR